MTRTALSMTVASLAAALALTGCSGTLSLGTKSVKRADVESRLASEIGTQTSSHPTVTCPGDLRGTVGTTMECTADINGFSYPVHVNVTGVRGSAVDYSFRMEGGPTNSPSPKPTRSTATRTPSQRPSPTSEPSTEPTRRPGNSGARVTRATVEVAIMNKVKDRTGKTVVVDCPSDLPAEVGTRMTCDWKQLDQRGKVEVEVLDIDADGKVNFRFRDVS